METRTQVLKDLLEYNAPLHTLKNNLLKYGWDADAPYVTLTRLHVVEILKRYIDGVISSSQMESWANMIECREDIEAEEGYETLVDEAIFQLANPLLTQSITVENCQQLLEILQK